MLKQLIYEKTTLRLSTETPPFNLSLRLFAISRAVYCLGPFPLVQCVSYQMKSGMNWKLGIGWALLVVLLFLSLFFVLWAF